MVPFDFTLTIIGIVEMSTVPSFTSFFPKMKHSLCMEKMDGRTPSKTYVDKILETAETRYLEMLNSEGEGTWTRIGKPNSAFIAGGGGTPNTVTCHHCGKEGHIRPDCPDRNTEKTNSGRGKNEGRGSGRR
jgi:hypothetical protein